MIRHLTHWHLLLNFWKDFDFRIKGTGYELLELVRITQIPTTKMPRLVMTNPGYDRIR